MKLCKSAVASSIVTVLFATTACSTMERESDQQPGTQTDTQSPSASQPSSESATATTAGSASAPGSAASMMWNEMALNQLHHFNQKEIALAKLAQQKGMSSEIKSTAQQIQADHQQLESQVQSVAKSQKVQLQSYQPATHEKATMDRLKRLSGSEFDQAFSMQMQQSHEAAAQVLRSVRSQLQDAQIASLIDSTLPKISQHQHMSSQAEGSVSGQAGESIPQ